MDKATQAHRWCGIDVSKERPCAAIKDAKAKHRTYVFENKAAQFSNLVAWAQEIAGSGVEVRFCMESTGDYGDELALYLTEAGYYVSVVNPAQVKHFGRYKRALNKTDKADSKLICDFAEDSSPAAWQFTDPVLRRLFRLVRRHRQLTKLETMEDNRRECPLAIGESCMRSIRKILKEIRAELRAIQREIDTLIASEDRLRQPYELILSFPGLAGGSAQTILAEMPPIEQASSAKAWAAASGTHATQSQSGTTLNRSNMSRGGRKDVRATLWMPVLNARSRIPELQSLYDRLKARGRTHLQAMNACVHKLLMMVYGVLKHAKPYEPRVPVPQPT